MTSSRRFPAPWSVEQMPGGYKVLDANGQALAHVYARETKQQAEIAKALTVDEARRIAEERESHERDEQLTTYRESPTGRRWRRL
jgi:hypothetical protein